MKKLIAANWKMNKTINEAIFLVQELKKLLKNAKTKNVEFAICPPFTALQAVSLEVQKTNIKLGAQNMHYENYGAFTGETSPLMIKELECEYVILGHSERREFFNEDDFFVNRKVLSALNHGLKPILCVGENLEQRLLGKTQEILECQLQKCLSGLNAGQILNVNMAYEPLWAISKGDPNKKAATKEDAEESHKFIRMLISKMYNKEISERIRIIYGGSMRPENAKELLSMPNIDGGLVGNASLDAKSFAEIVEIADEV